MTHRKPTRKKRISRPKPERYNTRLRAERRLVMRKKLKRNENEWRSRFYVIAVMVLVLAAMVISAYFIRTHEDIK